MSHFSQTIALFVFIDLIAMLAGCGTLTRNPVPPKLTAAARIPEMPEVRAWAGRVSPAMERDFAQSFEQESPADFPRGADGVVRYPHLALSGGGANGAFGAGFLNGWSTTGSRPVFKIVTGVSTGALMAPFAFLGPQYDAALHEFYTTTTTRDIFAIGSILSILISLLRGDSLADTGPLAALIARHVDAEFLRQDRRRAQSRPAALHRHRGPRFPGVRRLEHGTDRGERSAGGAGSLPQGHVRVRVRYRSPFRRFSSRSKPADGSTTRCTSTAPSRRPSS